jgi:hypothetical protein
LAMLKQLSLNAATMLRCNSHGSVLQWRGTESV